MQDIDCWRLLWTLAYSRCLISNGGATKILCWRQSLSAVGIQRRGAYTHFGQQVNQRGHASSRLRWRHPGCWEEKNVRGGGRRRDGQGRGHDVLQDRKGVGMDGEKGGRSVNRQSNHQGESCWRIWILFCRHWRALAGFRTEKRVDESLIVKIVPLAIE